MLPEALVINQGHISRHHHQSLSGLVGELARTIPLLRLPLLLDEQTEELVGENSRAEVPRAIEAGAVGVGTSEGVSANERNNLAVIEAHTVEDVTDVLLLLAAVGEPAVRSAGAEVLVGPARPPGDGRATQLLDGAGAGQGPEVGVGDPWELGLDGLEEITGVVEAGIGAVVGFRGESHSRTVAASSAGFLVICTTCVPGESHQNL